MPQGISANPVFARALPRRPGSDRFAGGVKMEGGGGPRQGTGAASPAPGGPKLAADPAAPAGEPISKVLALPLPHDGDGNGREPSDSDVSDSPGSMDSGPGI